MRSSWAIGSANDASEQEAEQVAGQVARSAMAAPVGTALNVKAAPGRAVQPTRQVHNLGGEPGARPAPAAVDQALARPGQALPAAQRSWLESSLGQDFSGVRVHTDAVSADSAVAIGAMAYTAGQNIVFGAGQYAPHSRAGQHLLAHELTHVAQQRGAAPRWVQRSVVPGAPPSGSREGGGGPISGEAPGAGSTGGGAGGQAGAGAGASAGAGAGAGDLPEICDPPAGMACTPAIDSPINPQMQFFFGVGSDVLSGGDVSQLQMVAAMLQIIPLTTSVRLDGYASTEGTCDANWALSCRRAQAVAQALIRPGSGVGLDPGAVERMAHGESDEAGASLAANRRALLSVDIALPPTPPPAVAPPTPAGCSPSGAQGTASGCTPNPGGASLPDVGGTHTESHPFVPCSMTQADVAASPNWCVDAQQAHGGETCYREIPTTAGAPGRQFCYSSNCCHDSADAVSVVSPTSPGSNSCCVTDRGSLPGHIWEDVVPELIDDPQRVIRDIFGF